MFLDSLDIANRTCQMVGVDRIESPTEDSVRCVEISNAYDKVRRAELRRNPWRFAIRKVALRALNTTTLLLVPATYDASKTYLTGEIVQDTNGAFWISEQSDNINNSPGGNNDAWEMYFGPATADLWDADTTYYAGELVYVVTNATPNGYQVYMSLVSDNADTPGDGTAYDATVQYKQDDVILYSTYQWRSLLPVNVGNTPAVGPTAWSSATPYTASQQAVGSDNYIYTALGSTTGSDPTTDGGTHWANTGTLNAWARSPVITASSLNWRPVVATLKNIVMIYPLGSGPSSQDTTRNAFRLPKGFLRQATQSPPGLLNPLGGPAGIGFSDYEYDGNFIVSPTVGVMILRFVADITKVSAMDDMFCEGTAYRVALAVCMKLTQSVSKQQQIEADYKLFMGEARLVNGIEQGPIELADDEYIQVRY